MKFYKKKIINDFSALKLYEDTNEGCEVDNTNCVEGCVTNINCGEECKSPENSQNFSLGLEAGKLYI